MIFMPSLRLPLSLTRRNCLLPSLTSHCCFWQSQKKLTKSAQKAVWATQIIKTIEQSEAPKSIAQLSLRQRILNLQAPTQDYAFDPECKKEVLQLFDGGIFLNPKVFEQGRITMAKQPISKKQVNVLYDAKTQSNSNQGKFIFCPNSLVTKHIFNYMRRSQTNNFFISGGYGISKTISIILYLHLSNFITTYFCEASRPNPSATSGQSEDKVNKAEEMQELQRKQLLREKAYKYFYWSIDFMHHGTKNLIKTLILEQTPQLQQNQRQKLTQNNEISIDLQQLYPQNVQVRSMVDHIDTLMTMIRRSNYQKQKLNEMEEDEYRKQAQLTFQQDIIQIKILIEYLKQFKPLGKQFGVNQSAAIHRQLLKTSNEKNGLLSLGLEDRQPLTYYRVPYEKTIASPEGANEFKQLIWFEIERRLPSNKADNKKILTLKKRFDEKIEGINIPGFAKFLTARQSFSNKQDFVNLQDERHEQKFMTNLKRILQSFDRQGLKTEKTLFQDLFQECEQQEKVVIEKLYQQAKSQVQNANKRHQLLQFNYKDMEADPRLSNYNLPERLSQGNRNTSDFQEKMPYELLENGMIRLPWTVQQFIIISQKYFQPQVKREFKQYLSQFDRDVVMQYDDIKQMYFKSILRKCLKKSPGTKAHIRLFTEQVNNKRNRRYYGGEKIQIKHVTKFLRFSKKSRQNFVYHNLKQLLDISRKNPGEACVAIPHYINKKGNYVLSKKSKVDFIICKYGPKNVFNITTYDTTALDYQVGKKQANHAIFYKNHIFQNMKKFKIPAAKFRFRHVILCPWENCKLPKVKKMNGFTYTLSYGDSLNNDLISECNDKKLIPILQEIQVIIKISLLHRQSNR